jgi:hypothetical protein
MRDWLLRIHLYGGLLCSSYLLIFGLSSLMFSHPNLFPSEGRDRVTWNRDVVVDTTLSDKELSESVRNSLKLMGWGPQWEVNREEAGIIKLMVNRPGKIYRIRLSEDGKHAEVEEQRQGYWSVVSKLHAFGNLPGSSFVSTWRFYTELCTVVVIFAGASGFYFFASRPRKRRSGWILLGGGSGLSLLLILTVWLRG